MKKPTLLKKSLQVLLVLSFILLFSACDPFKLLLVTNETTKDINVEIVLQDCDASFIQELRTKKVLEKIELNITEETQIFEHFFGIGTWSKEELSTLLDCTKTIIIQEGINTKRIEGEALQQMLPKKREGLFKNVMTIKILPQ